VILFEIVGSEAHPVYQDLEIANGNRQYDFLRSIVATSLAVGRPFLSSHVIKAFNFQAITCLHTNAGEYRPCPVTVGAGGPTPYQPPEQHRVQALMDDFVNTVNRMWETTDALVLAAYVLWRLNWIHPFINGNGRSARAASYFVLCLKAGLWLPGAPILPELLRRERAQYVTALKAADASYAAGNLDLTELHALMEALLKEQLMGGAQPPAGPAPAAPPLLPAP
jgi:Fic family protein